MRARTSILTLSILAMLSACGGGGSGGGSDGGGAQPPPAPPPPSSSLELLSKSATGEVGFLASGSALSTSTGQYVVFASEASNLVPNDSNSIQDVFLVDRTGGSIERVSVATNGDEANANPAGQTNSQLPLDISPDGRFILFSSHAPNLVADDTNGGIPDVFLRDTQLGTTTRVNLMSGGTEVTEGSGAAAMTPDARYVVFGRRVGAGQNSMFWRDTANNETIEAVTTIDGQPPNGQLFNLIFDGPDRIMFTSGASNLVANDTNGEVDGFVATIDIANGIVANVERLPIGLSGIELDGQTRVKSGRIDCFAFTTDASNMIPSVSSSQEQLYLQHTLTGQTVVEHISKNSSGDPANNEVWWAVVSQDCTRVLYSTRASNLSNTPDGNGSFDVYAAEAPDWTAIRLSLNEDGTDSGQDSAIRLGGSILTDLDYVVFTAFGPLVPDDINGVQDVYGVPFP